MNLRRKYYSDARIFVQNIAAGGSFNLALAGQIWSIGPTRTARILNCSVQLQATNAIDVNKFTVSGLGLWVFLHPDAAGTLVSSQILLAAPPVDVYTHMGNIGGISFGSILPRPVVINSQIQPSGAAANFTQAVPTSFHFLLDGDVVNNDGAAAHQVTITWTAEFSLEQDAIYQ